MRLLLSLREVLLVGCHLELKFRNCCKVLFRKWNTIFLEAESRRELGLQAQFFLYQTICGKARSQLEGDIKSKVQFYIYRRNINVHHSVLEQPKLWGCTRGNCSETMHCKANETVFLSAPTIELSNSEQEATFL
ncbi:hypothetical protein O6H91_Y408200 [Diphasiastrum complanatum]|nr:hypothetical protein O6H91_Y408200 [Diphasiastrum complanatum]